MIEPQRYCTKNRIVTQNEGRKNSKLGANLPAWHSEPGTKTNVPGCWESGQLPKGEFP